MRLILKHLLRSIKKKPTQPIILVLTLALSVIVSIVSLSTDLMIQNEINTNTAEQFGDSSFNISLSSDSSSRFMFSSEVEELLGEGTSAIGVFELAVFASDGRASLAVATELDRISDFFDFRFSEITPITRLGAGDCVFISRDFADKYNLALSDTVELEVGRIKKNYKVAGISETDFMASYDIMLDVGTVMRILTSTSPVLAPMGDSFKPGGTIFVKAPEERVDECIEALLSDEKYSDKIISIAHDQMDNEEMVTLLSLPMRISVLVSLLLAAAVTFTCFYILSTERSEENLILSAAGAGKVRLNAVQYIEVTLYWLVGGAVGVLLTPPILGLVTDFSGFRYSRAALDFSSVIIAELALLLTSLATVAIFTVRPRSVRKIRGKGLAVGLLTLLYVISYVSVLTLSPKKTLIPFVATIVLILPLTLMVSGDVLQLVCKGLDRKVERAGDCSFCGIGKIPGYAVKNVLKVRILTNTSRLFATVSVFTISLTVMIMGYYGSVRLGGEMLRGDYGVLGVTDRCYESLSCCESVDSVANLYISRELIGNALSTVISTDSPEALADGLGVSELPRGNEAIISRAHARMLSLKVGDSLTISTAGRECKLVISDIIPSATQFLLVDAESLGISYNMLIVDGVDGVPTEALFEEISFATSLELVGIMPLSELLYEMVRSVEIFLRAGLVLLGIALVFVFVGIFDNLVESYRARREEFELYRLAGMSPGEIKRMKLCEILLTFGVGLGVGIITFVIEFIVMCVAVMHVGQDVIAGITYLL